MTHTEPTPALPPRLADGHKGTFGTVVVVGGQAQEPRVMLGGPAFSALGALRSGAGLAVLAVPAPLMAHALAVAPSATGLALPVSADGAIRASAAAELLDGALERAQALVLGPGLGVGDAQQTLVLRMLALEAPPMVVDADALNAIAAAPVPQLDLRAAAVLTPHPGEYERLARALGIAADPIDPATRPKAASLLAQRLGCVVVLKGAGTVVTDGQRSWVAQSGNAALATAGSGDVLSGVIAGMIAQFGRAPHRMGLFDCACLGVHLHGLAADRWAATKGNAGMLATDLLEAIPDVMAMLRQ